MPKTNRDGGKPDKNKGEDGPWAIQRYKLVILGAALAGKSSLVSYQTKGNYLDLKEPSIVATYYSIYLDKSVKFDTWEVGGEERWHSLAYLYYKDAQAALIVYDIGDEASLLRAKECIMEVRRKVSHDLVIALVANKVDLRDFGCIDSEKIQTYAKDNGLIFMETSAKTGQNITETFNVIAEELKARLIPAKMYHNSKPKKYCGCIIL